MSILTTTSKPPTAASCSGVHFSLLRAEKIQKRTLHQNTRSLVTGLQVGSGIQKNSNDSFMTITTGSVERGLLEAAMA
jgi:hypothetical protein